jgi:hypothetical protein
MLSGGIPLEFSNTREDKSAAAAPMPSPESSLERGHAWGVLIPGYFDGDRHRDGTIF